jgi:hypothetical protein
LFRVWTLLWACLPEAKDWNVRINGESAIGMTFEDRRSALKSLIKESVVRKTPEYTYWYSKVEKFFEVYSSGGEQGKLELCHVFVILLCSSRREVLAMPKLANAMQVPGGLCDSDLGYMLFEIVEAHIKYTASLLRVDLKNYIDKVRFSDVEVCLCRQCSYELT